MTDKSSEGLREESDTYFANEPPFSNEIGDAILKRCEEYSTFLRTTGRFWLWRRCYDYYYPSVISNGRMRKTGDQGQFTNLCINNYRNLLLHIQNLTTSQKPSFEPRAINSDYKSQAQTILCGGILDYFMREKDIPDFINQGVEDALVFGEGFVSCTWNQHDGDLVTIDLETGIRQNQGDVKLNNFTPLDVIRDFTKETSWDHDWYIVRSYENRHNLMALYPNMKDEIQHLATAMEQNRDMRIASYVYEASQEVPIFTLYHRKTPAVPDGRMVVMGGISDCILVDTALPYDEIPVYRIAGSDQRGTIWGYSIGFDLLPIQECQNMLNSTIVTNQSTFGVQSIAVGRGSGISVEHLGAGLKLIEYDSKMPNGAGKPEPMQFTQTSPEIFNYLGELDKYMETISGVNSVARGNPDTSLKSGSALALVQSQAIQFSMNMQESYASLLEDIGTQLIRLIQRYANTPRIATIAGKANSSYLKEFVGSDLDKIERVTVDPGNPLTRTTAGKVNLADALLQHGFIQDPQQYITVMLTGQLEPLIQNQTAQLMLIRSENEMLSAGKTVQALLTDDHALHLKEHDVVMADPTARQDPALLKVYMDHMQQHMALLSNPQNANLLMVLGQHPIAPPGPPGPPPGAPQAPGGVPTPGQGAQAPAGPVPPQGPPQPQGPHATVHHAPEPKNPPHVPAHPMLAGQILSAANPVTGQAAKVNMPQVPQPKAPGQQPLT